MSERDKRSHSSDFSLSGLHKQFDRSPWLRASDVIELAFLHGNAGEKLLAFPLATFGATERAIRKMGKALYSEDIPHYLVACRPQGVLLSSRGLVLEVRVPEATAAFDVLIAAGFQANPMRALSVTDKRRVVCIRLLNGCDSSGKYQSQL